MIRNVINSLKNNFIYTGFKNKTGKLKQGALNLLPDITYNNPDTSKIIGNIGRNVSSAENRLILGATALMTQPFIDACNKDVDKKTRRVSVCRTIAKIIAGTTTGYFIRKGAIKLTKNWSEIPAKKVPKYKILFTPKNAKPVNSEAFKQYQNTMGTIVALIVMMITNFTIDAPMTKGMTNFFVSKSGGDK